MVNALAHPKAQQVRDTIVRKHLFFAMVLGRFLGITRPLYALTLGALRINPRRVAHFELIIAFVWTSF